MDPKADTPHAGPPAVPRKVMSRRNRVLGGLLAVLVLAGLGWLAWQLTHADGAAGAPGARRGPSATTVGVATAESD